MNDSTSFRLFKVVVLVIKTLLVKLNMCTEWLAWSADICRYSTFSSQFFILWLLVSPVDPYRLRNIISALFLHSAKKKPKKQDLELLWLLWEFCFQYNVDMVVDEIGTVVHVRDILYRIVYISLVAKEKCILSSGSLETSNI